MDNRRLLLLIVFSFSLVMLWDAWQKYSQPKAASPATSGSAEAPAPQPSTNLHAPLPAAPATTAVASADNRRQSRSEPICLSPRSPSRAAISFASNSTPTRTARTSQGLRPLRGQAPVSCPEWPDRREPAKPQNPLLTASGNRELAGDAKTVELRLEAPVSNGVKVTKIYTFTRGSYLIHVPMRLTMVARRKSLRTCITSCSVTSMQPEGESSMVSTFTGPAVYTDQEKYQKVLLPTSKKARPSLPVRPTMAGLRWFSTILSRPGFLKQGCRANSTCASSKAAPTPAVSAGVIVPAPVAAPGAKVGDFCAHLCRTTDSGHS
jgi:YidC/Oxa1 family membrane protein insertase